MMRFWRPTSPRRIAVAALAITAASLPLYVVRWRVGPIPTTLLEVLILVTVAAYAVTLWTERRRPAARTSYEIPIALLLLAGIVGIVVAPDHTRAFGIYRAYFLETIALFYIAVDLIRTQEDLRTVLAVAGAGSAVFAIGQIVTFGITLAHHAVHIDAGPAFLNTSSNSVALYLEPPFAFAVGLSLFASSRRERWLSLGAVALFLTALVLTLSRASYIALAVLAVVAVFSLSDRRRRMWAIGVMALVLLAFIELPFISQRLGTFAHSIQLRLSIYRAALRMLSERPILGAGISGFPIRVAPFRPAGEEIELYPHNLWLTTWSDLGLLGLISLAVIFFRLLWQGVRALSSAEGIYRAATWGMVGALVLYLVHGLFDSPYWKNDLSAEFWLMAALGVIGMRGSFTQRASSKAAR